MKFRTLLTLSAFVAMFFSSANAEPLKVGDKAPEASALTDAGSPITLGELYKQQHYTLVYFYPKAGTSGCTAQGCSLRDANTQLAQKGVTIVGVSSDSVEAQKKFKDENHFQFTLLADPDKNVIKAFGQAGTGMAKREAYLIKDGVIVYKDTGVTGKQGETVLAYLNEQKS